jgi:hypothetical protein
MTFASGPQTPVIYGNWINGTGTTLTGTGRITLSGQNSQTITSAGSTFTVPLSVDSPSGTVTLQDALTSSNDFFLTQGTFNANNFNVTVFKVDTQGTQTKTLTMGSGLWTLTGNNTNVWDVRFTNRNTFTFNKNTANILLSDNSTTARTFWGNGYYYNKLTIGGATGTSTTTIDGDNQFTELASTKTVAHTIAFGTRTQTFGAWTVTGTAGNVVTLTGTGTNHILAGSATTGIDYLAMGSIGFATTSPGEFYAGANSTGTAVAPVYRTAKPADSTRYWVGGTGNWSDTARWSASSGGASGASIPRSHDNVVFDSASNATAYTATVNAVTGGIRCNTLTIAGPASGNLTLAGSVAIDGIHGNVTLPATGLTRTYTGNITLSGSTTGKTFTTNGVVNSSQLNINGFGCEWSLGSALNNTGRNIFIRAGTFNTANYNFTCADFFAIGVSEKTINLGSSTITVENIWNFSDVTLPNLTFNAGTSQLNLSNNFAPMQSNGGQTYYNVTFTSTGLVTPLIQGSNTFNNLTIAGRTSAGVASLSINANQTINGTLTLSTGTNATCRTFVCSDTVGTIRTLTCNAIASLQDIDFRDITIAGAAAPVSGTRLGDCGGNLGITFPAPKTVYRVGTANFWQSDSSWSDTSGGVGDTALYFPLAQDTAVIDQSTTFTGQLNFASYNIGTLNCSTRTTAITLGFGQPATFYGNFTLGPGISLINQATQTFSGRGTMTFTSAGKPITFPISITAPNGTFQLGDALNTTQLITHNSGTLDAVTYNLTCSSFLSATTNIRAINMGSGLWTFSGNGTVWVLSLTNNTFSKGTANILLTNTTTSARTFEPGDATYNKLTIGGTTGTSQLTFSSNGTFAEITSIKTVPHTIALGTTTQRVGAFTVTGTAGNVVTITGAGSNLIYTGGGFVSGLDYLNVQGRVFGPNGEITGIWNAGANSVNSGSLGWDFTSVTAPVPLTTGNFFFMFA